MRNAAEKRVKRILQRKKRGVGDKKRAAAASDDVKLSVSPVMLVMATVFVAFGMAYELACSLTAVILHEFAHARVAKRLGYALNEIKLMPYGAALCGSADILPKHELLIAIAGPALNLMLGLIFAALWWLAPASYPFTETFCRCNIYIGVFNLLPVYPMDGGRILYALLSFKADRKKSYTAVRIISGIAGAAALALFAVSAVYSLNVCLLSVGVFMVASAFIPDGRARYYALFAFAGRRARLHAPFEVRRHAVDAGAELMSLCKSLDPDRFTVFEVYGADMKKLGELDETGLIAAAGRLGYGATAGAALREKF